MHFCAQQCGELGLELKCTSVHSNAVYSHQVFQYMLNDNIDWGKIHREWQAAMLSLTRIMTSARSNSVWRKSICRHRHKHAMQSPNIGMCMRTGHIPGYARRAGHIPGYARRSGHLPGYARRAGHIPGFELRQRAADRARTGGYLETLLHSRIMSRAVTPAISWAHVGHVSLRPFLFCVHINACTGGDSVGIINRLPNEIKIQPAGLAEIWAIAGAGLLPPSA